MEDSENKAKKHREIYKSISLPDSDTTQVIVDMPVWRKHNTEACFKEAI